MIDIVDGQLEEDEFTIISNKIPFLFTRKNSMCCGKCNTQTIFYSQSRHLNLYPDRGDNIQSLISISLNSTLTKHCGICLENTSHMETSSIRQVPKFLILVINRYPALPGLNKTPLIYSWLVLVRQWQIL